MQKSIINNNVNIKLMLKMLGFDKVTLNRKINKMENLPLHTVGNDVCMSVQSFVTDFRAIHSTSSRMVEGGFSGEDGEPELVDEAFPYGYAREAYNVKHKLQKEIRFNDPYNDQILYWNHDAYATAMRRLAHHNRLHEMQGDKAYERAKHDWYYNHPQTYLPPRSTKAISPIHFDGALEADIQLNPMNKLILRHDWDTPMARTPLRGATDVMSGFAQSGEGYSWTLFNPERRFLPNTFLTKVTGGAWDEMQNFTQVGQPVSGRWLGLHHDADELSTYTATELPDRTQYGRRSYDIRTLGNIPGPVLARRRDSGFPFKDIHDRHRPPNPPESPEFNFRFTNPELICGGTYTIDAIGPRAKHYPPTFLPGESRFVAAATHFSHLFRTEGPAILSKRRGLQELPWVGPFVGDFYRGLVFSIRQTLRDQTLFADGEFQKIDIMRLATAEPKVFAQNVLPAITIAAPDPLANLSIADHTKLVKSLHAFMGVIGRAQDTFRPGSLGGLSLERWSAVINHLCTRLVPSGADQAFWHRVQAGALNSFFNYILEQSGLLALRRCDRTLKQLLATPQYSAAATSNLNGLLVKLCRTIGYDSVQASLLASDSYNWLQFFTVREALAQLVGILPAVRAEISAPIEAGLSLGLGLAQKNYLQLVQSLSWLGLTPPASAFAGNWASDELAVRRVALLDGLLTVLLGSHTDSVSARAARFSRVWAASGFNQQVLFSPSITAVLARDCGQLVFRGRYLGYSAQRGLYACGSMLVGSCLENVSILLYGPKLQPRRIGSLAQSILRSGVMPSTLESTLCTGDGVAQIAPIAMKAVRQWLADCGAWLQGQEGERLQLVAASQQLYFILSILPKTERRAFQNMFLGIPLISDFLVTYAAAITKLPASGEREVLVRTLESLCGALGAKVSHPHQVLRPTVVTFQPNSSIPAELLAQIPTASRYKFRHRASVKTFSLIKSGAIRAEDHLIVRDLLSLGLAFPNNTVISSLIANYLRMGVSPTARLSAPEPNMPLRAILIALTAQFQHNVVARDALQEATLNPQQAQLNAALLATQTHLRSAADTSIAAQLVAQLEYVVQTPLVQLTTDATARVNGSPQQPAIYTDVIDAERLALTARFKALFGHLLDTQTVTRKNRIQVEVSTAIRLWNQNPNLVGVAWEDLSGWISQKVFSKAVTPKYLDMGPDLLVSKDTDWLLEDSFVSTARVIPNLVPAQPSSCVPIRMSKSEVGRYMVVADTAISLTQTKVAADLVKGGRFYCQATPETLLALIRELAFKPFGLGLLTTVRPKIESAVPVDALSLFTVMSRWAELYATQPQNLHPRVSTPAVSAISRELSYAASPAHGFLFALLLEAANTAPRPFGVDDVLRAWAVPAHGILDAVKAAVARTIQAQVAGLTTTPALSVPQALRQLVRIECIVRNYTHQIAKIEMLPINSLERISMLNMLALEVFNFELDSALSYTLRPVATSAVAQTALTPWRLGGSFSGTGVDWESTQRRISAYRSPDSNAVRSLFQAYDAYRGHVFLEKMPLTTPKNLNRISTIFIEELFTPDFLLTLAASPLSLHQPVRAVPALATILNTISLLERDGQTDTLYTTLGQSVSQYVPDLPIDSDSTSDSSAVRAALWTLRRLADYTQSAERLRGVSAKTIDTYLGRVSEKVLRPLLGVTGDLGPTNSLSFWKKQLRYGRIVTTSGVVIDGRGARDTVGSAFLTLQDLRDRDNASLCAHTLGLSKILLDLVLTHIQNPTSPVLKKLFKPYLVALNHYREHYTGHIETLSPDNSSVTSCILEGLKELLTEPPTEVTLKAIMQKCAHRIVDQLPATAYLEEMTVRGEGALTMELTRLLQTTYSPNQQPQGTSIPLSALAANFCPIPRPDSSADLSNSTLLLYREAARLLGDEFFSKGAELPAEITTWIYTWVEEFSRDRPSLQTHKYVSAQVYKEFNEYIGGRLRASGPTVQAQIAQGPAGFYPWVVALRQFNPKGLVTPEHTTLFARTGGLLAQAFPAAGLSTNVVEKLKYFGGRAADKLRQATSIDLYFTRTATVDLSMLREWYETSLDAPTNNLTWGRSAFGDSELRAHEEVEETWLELLQGVYRGATQPSLDTTTRWRFYAWLERRRWEAKTELAVLLERLNEQLLSSAFAPTYETLMDLWTTEHSTLDLATSYLNYLFARILVPFLYLKRRVWELAESPLEYPVAEATLPEDSVDRRGFIRQRLETQYHDLPGIEGETGTFDLSWPVEMVLMCSFPFLVLAAYYIYVEKLSRRAREEGYGATSQYYLPLDYLEWVDWGTAIKRPDITTRILDEFPEFTHLQHTKQNSIHPLHDLHPFDADMYLPPDIYKTPKPETDPYFGIRYVDEDALDDTELEPGYESPEERLGWTINQIMRTTKMADQMVYSWIEDMPKEHALWWRWDTDNRTTQNAPGISDEDYLDMLYINQYRLFFTQIRSSWKHMLWLWFSTSWFWGTLAIVAWSELFMSSTSNGGKSAWRFPVDMNTILSPQFWYEWGMLRYFIPIADDRKTANGWWPKEYMEITLPTHFHKPELNNHLYRSAEAWEMRLVGGAFDPLGQMSKEELLRRMRHMSVPEAFGPYLRPTSRYDANEEQRLNVGDALDTALMRDYLDTRFRYGPEYNDVINRCDTIEDGVLWEVINETGPEHLIGFVSDFTYGDQDTMAWAYNPVKTKWAELASRMTASEFWKLRALYGSTSTNPQIGADPSIFEKEQTVTRDLWRFSNIFWNSHWCPTWVRHKFAPSARGPAYLGNPAIPDFHVSPLWEKRWMKMARRRRLPWYRGMNNAVINALTDEPMDMLPSWYLQYIFKLAEPHRTWTHVPRVDETGYAGNPWSEFLQTYPHGVGAAHLLSPLTMPAVLDGYKKRMYEATSYEESLIFEEPLLWTLHTNPGKWYEIFDGIGGQFTGHEPSEEYVKRRFFDQLISPITKLPPSFNLDLVGQLPDEIMPEIQASAWDIPYGRLAIRRLGRILLPEYFPPIYANWDMPDVYPVFVINAFLEDEDEYEEDEDDELALPFEEYLPDPWSDVDFDRDLDEIIQPRARYQFHTNHEIGGDETTKPHFQWFFDTTAQLYDKELHGGLQEETPLWKTLLWDMRRWDAPTGARYSPQAASEFLENTQSLFEQQYEHAQTVHGLGGNFKNADDVKGRFLAATKRYATKVHGNHPFGLETTQQNLVPDIWRSWRSSLAHFVLKWVPDQWYGRATVEGIQKYLGLAPLPYELPEDARSEWGGCWDLEEVEDRWSDFWTTTQEELHHDREEEYFTDNQKVALQWANILSGVQRLDRRRRQGVETDPARIEYPHKVVERPIEEMADSEFDQLFDEDDTTLTDLPIRYRTFAHTTLDLTFELENIEYIKALRHRLTSDQYEELLDVASQKYEQALYQLVMAMAPSDELAELIIDNPESCLDYVTTWYPELTSLFSHEEASPYDYTLASETAGIDPSVNPAFPAVSGVWPNGDSHAFPRELRLKVSSLWQRLSSLQPLSDALTSMLHIAIDLRGWFHNTPEGYRYANKRRCELALHTLHRSAKYGHFKDHINAYSTRVRMSRPRFATMLKIALQRLLYRQYVFWRTTLTISRPHIFSVSRQSKMHLQSTYSTPLHITIPSYAPLEPNATLAQTARSAWRTAYDPKWFNLPLREQLSTWATNSCEQARTMHSAVTAGLVYIHSLLPGYLMKKVVEGLVHIWVGIGAPIFFRSVEVLGGFLGGGLFYLVDLLTAVISTVLWYLSQINFAALRRILQYTLRDIPTVIGYYAGTGFRGLVLCAVEAVRLYKFMVHGLNTHLVSRLYEPAAPVTQRTFHNVRHFITGCNVPDMWKIPATVAEYVVYGIKWRLGRLVTAVSNYIWYFSAGGHMPTYWQTIMHYRYLEFRLKRLVPSILARFAIYSTYINPHDLRNQYAWAHRWYVRGVFEFFLGDKTTHSGLTTDHWGTSQEASAARPEPTTLETPHWAKATGTGASTGFWASRGRYPWQGRNLRGRFAHPPRVGGYRCAPEDEEEEANWEENSVVDNEEPSTEN